MSHLDVFLLVRPKDLPLMSRALKAAEKAMLKNNPSKRRKDTLDPPSLRKMIAFFTEQGKKSPSPAAKCLCLRGYT